MQTLTEDGKQLRTIFSVDMLELLENDLESLFEEIEEPEGIFQDDWQRILELVQATTYPYKNSKNRLNLILMNTTQNLKAK